jgi:hypothetical protein
VEIGLRMNRPDGADGSIEYRVDGQIVGPVEGLQWRTTDALAVDSFTIDSYNAFEAGAPPESRPNVLRYDNVVLSRAPVGCLGRQQ